MDGASIYDAIAEVYDLSGQSRFSLKMLSYLLELLALRRSKPQRVADLACGTGAAAVALAKRKFKVSGVDGSAAMLARARQRAACWKVDVDWRQQLLTELDLPQAYELATCLYDSLNHLTEPLDFRKALFGVRRLLVPGGLFFFDMNTPYAYASVWGQAEDSHLADNYARFWRSSYERTSGIATLQATYFQRQADELYRRVSITHHARGYTPDEVRRGLEEAGFELLNAYQAMSFEPVDERTYRVAYLARA